MILYYFLTLEILEENKFLIQWVAFRAFLDSLPKEKAKKCLLMLHTEYVTDAGTHLGKVKEYLFDEDYYHNVKFLYKN